MYRYSQQMRNSVGNTKLQGQILRGFTILLVVAVIVLAIVGGSAIRFSKHEQAQFAERMQSEAAQAITQVNNLSRTGGSTTTNLLGKIRQHVYAMESLQRMHMALRDPQARVVEESAFAAIYAVLDTFDAKLQTGQQTKEPQTQLSNMLTSLNQTVANTK